MVKPKVKILLAYFKPTYLFKNDLLIPVHAGRAVAMSESRNRLSGCKRIRLAMIVVTIFPV